MLTLLDHREVLLQRTPGMVTDSLLSLPLGYSHVHRSSTSAFLLIETSAAYLKKLAKHLLAQPYVPPQGLQEVEAVTAMREGAQALCAG